MRTSHYKSQARKACTHAADKQHAWRNSVNSAGSQRTPKQTVQAGAEHRTGSKKRLSMAVAGRPDCES